MEKNWSGPHITDVKHPRDKLFAELKFWADYLREGYEIGAAEHEWLNEDKENSDHKIIIKVLARIKELVNELLPDVSCETSTDAEELKAEATKAPTTYFTYSGQ